MIWVKGRVVIHDFLLCSVQRLVVMDKFKKKIQEQANAKKAESSKQFHGNQHKVVPSPNGEQTKAKIHTDKELAKLAG